MSEEPKMEGETKVETPVNTETGSEQSAISIIEQARKEREGLDKTLKEIREERAKLEEIRAKEYLGGRTVAGTVKEKTVAEKEAEEAKKMVDAFYSRV